MRQRVSAIIIKNNQILLIHRIKAKEDYFVFPGGGIEVGENSEGAMKREIKEELNLEVVLAEPIFEINNKGQQEFFFVIKEFSGMPTVGNGPELESMNEQNQYILEWIELDKVKLTNLFPVEAKSKLIDFYKSKRDVAIFEHCNE